jgi:hypothetical protein
MGKKRKSSDQRAGAADAVYAGLRQHVRTFFKGPPEEEHCWTVGPAADILPRLRIIEFAPGPRANLWVYVSLGAWEANPDGDAKLEFLIMAPYQDLRHVELLTMTVWYHSRQTLGLGHTFPIGEPWLRGSLCDHMLVSRPYPFGPELEICQLGEQHLHVFWLLPITPQERAFKVANGLEELEQRFEAAGLQYANPLRSSVVQSGESS